MSYHKFTYIYVFIFFASLAALRPVGLDRDSATYYNASINPAGDFRWMEPTFYYISLFNNYFFASSSFTLLLIYSSVALGLKFHFLLKYTRYIYTSIWLYLSSYFVLLEMTQIRAAVAVGFFMWSLHDILHRNKKAYLLKILVATTFHYSALIYLPAYFLTVNKLNKYFWMLMPIGLLALGQLLGSQHLISITPAFLEPKLNSYLLQQMYAPIVTPYRIMLLIIYILFVYNAHRIRFEKELFYLTIKLLGLSIGIYFLCINVSEVASVRLSGMYSFTIIIMLPYAYQMFKDKQLVLTGLVAYAVVNLFYSLLFRELLKFEDYF